MVFTTAYLADLMLAVETSIPRDIRSVTAIAEESGEVVGTFNKMSESPPRATLDDFLKELAQLQICLDLVAYRFALNNWQQILNDEYLRQIARFEKLANGKDDVIL